MVIKFVTTRIFEFEVYNSIFLNKIKIIKIKIF